MNWLQSILYGFVSGLSEFLPISSKAHQQILLHLFGVDVPNPVRDFVVHIALLLALVSACRTMFEQVRRDYRIQQRVNGRSARQSRVALDMKLVKVAAAPMLIGMVVLTYLIGRNSNLITISVFLLVNGVILYAPDRMLQANKDVRAMSGLDSILIGLSGAVSAFCGISRTGAMVSTSVARGADRQNALNWALLLCFPALIFLSAVDLIGIFTVQTDISFWSGFLSYVLSGLTAYIGGYLSVLMLKYFIVNNSISGFCYYSWGAALFTFIIYLTAV